MRRDFIRTRILVPVLSVAAITIFPACEGKGITDLAEAQEAGPRPTFAMVVEPAEPILEAGETIQLRAFLKNSVTGALHPLGAEVRWTSKAPKRATVDETGQVEAHEAGKVIILATRKDANPFYGQTQAEAKVLVK